MRLGTFGLRFLLTTVVLFFGASLGHSQVTSPLKGGLTVTTAGDNVSRDFTINNAGNVPVRYSFSIQPGGPRDQGNRVPRRDARGGPDDFEYEWRDSDEEDGPVFEWIDIIDRRGVINLEADDDDSLYGMYDLGFDFPFYGEEYNQIAIDANGFATFLPAFNFFPFWPGWEALPNANPGAEASTPPRALLAINFQDLNPAVGGDIYLWTDNTTAIVTWANIPHFADGNNQNPWTFQIIINSDGYIKYQYQNVGAYDAAHDIVIGLQNEARDRGFTVALDDQNYIQAGKALAFGPPSAWINWVAIEPQSGEIRGGADQDITVNFIPGDHEDGYYWANIALNLDNGQERQITPVVMSLNMPVGSIEGAVTDAANREPVEGALVELTDVGMWVLTDENGGFAFENLPPRTYQLSVSAENFNDYNFGAIRVEADRTADGSVQLRHGEFTPSINEIIQQLAPNTSTEIGFNIANGGNAVVHFTSDRRLLGDANAAPWETRRTINAGAGLGDDRVEGVTFVEGNYYLAGAAGDATNRVYVLDENGDEVSHYDQVGHSRYGYKDLEFDGEWIWASGEDSIYAFTPNGDVQLRVRGPYNPTNNLAWDSDRELMVVSGTTTNISTIDRNGNVVGQALNRRGLRIYGMSYFPEDPDGYKLYLITQPVDQPMSLYKMNLANGDTAKVHTFDFGDGGAPGGIYITNQFDVYSWVMMMMTNVVPANGGDKLQIVQVAARRDWMQISPQQGEIQPGEQTDFTLTLDAEGLPEADFEGEIVFMHDARGSETRLPITLSVVLGPVHTIRQFPLAIGWNTFSSNVDPDQGNLPALFNGLVQQGLVAFVKDGAGHFYSPSDNFNSIPDWTITEGYQVKMMRPAALSIEGMTVMADDPIPLHNGWQIAPYYPRAQVAANVGFNGIVENLVIAKDGDGGFFMPGYNFNSMAPLKEGQGYQLKLSADAELVYQMMGQAGAPFATLPPTPVHYLISGTTGRNMSLLLLDAPDGEYAAFVNGQLVGAGVSVDGRCGFAIWGDDPTTSAIDGAVDASSIEIRQWNGTSELATATTLVSGKLEYQNDGITVGRVLNSAAIPTTLVIDSVYPNPFNAVAEVRYSLPETGTVRLALFDLSGRLVQELESGEQVAGSHIAVVNGANLTSGLYFLKLEMGSSVSTAKLMLVK